MRRADREVTDFQEILSMLAASDVMHLAMVDDGRPYAVPLNFGFEADGRDIIIYFHSAKEGRKIDILRKNPAVFFVIDSGHELVAGRKACDYTFRYASVMGSGIAVAIEDREGKRHGLSLLMKHAGRMAEEPQFPDKAIDAVAVYSIRCSDYAAKAHR